MHTFFRFTHLFSISVSHTACSAGTKFMSAVVQTLALSISSSKVLACEARPLCWGGEDDCPCRVEYLVGINFIPLIIGTISGWAPMESRSLKYIGFLQGQRLGILQLIQQPTYSRDSLSVSGEEIQSLGEEDPYQAIRD